ncbi:MAG: hypothetical protein WBA43_05360 [Elainellaceae cyanobacterium]
MNVHSTEILSLKGTDHRPRHRSFWSPHLVERTAFLRAILRAIALDVNVFGQIWVSWARLRLHITRDSVWLIRP